MRTYQLIVVTRPVAEGERKTLIETMKSWLKDVKVVSENQWGSKALAYAIKRELTGFYYEFELEAEKLPADFEKRLINADGILRHLVIRKK